MARERLAAWRKATVWGVGEIGDGWKYMSSTQYPFYN